MHGTRLLRTRRYRGDLGIDLLKYISLHADNAMEKYLDGDLRKLQYTKTPL